MTPEQADRAKGMLEPAPALEDLAPCELVIEAAPERLEIKRALFERLGAVVSGDCVLATNTSSLLVTALADAAPDPSRVVGMHFFNPPPVMRLLEVVAGAESSARAIAVARAAGEAMGKHVIEAVDGPGFIVNRCNRPFGLEALKLLQERVATFDQIDRACRLGGGFRMGPFELMDLVGVDVGLDVSRSFYEQSFGEPRWRPSPITVKTVAAGRLGRKAGRGYYEYPASGDHRPADPDPPPVGGGDGVVVIAGETPLAEQLREAAGEAGWAVVDPLEAQELATPFLILDLTGIEEPEAPLQGAPQAICVAAGSLAALDPGGSAVGFHALPPLRSTRLVELTRGPDSADSAAEAAEHFFATLGKHTLWVDDAPGLVLGRIVCQVVNEAAFALGEGLGERRGHRRRDGPWPQLSARHPRLGRRDRPRPRAVGARRPGARTRRGALPSGARRCAASDGRVASAARPEQGSSSTGRTDRCSRYKSRPLDGLKRASGGQSSPQPSNTQDRLRGCRLPPSLDVCSVASGALNRTTDRDRGVLHVRRRHGQGAAGGDIGPTLPCIRPGCGRRLVAWALASATPASAHAGGHCRHARTPIVAATHRQLDRAVICLVNRQRRNFGLPRLRQSRRLRPLGSGLDQLHGQPRRLLAWVGLRRADLGGRL